MTIQHHLPEPINLGRGLPDAGRVAGEQELLAYVETALARAGWLFPRFLLVDFYVALKTQHFVILLGREGQGKSELVQIFSETLVGSGSAQIASIQVRSPRGGASEEDLVSNLYERFGWIKFLEFLERAAAPENSGKPYFLCLEDLSPVDVETYFELLIRGDRPGEFRLALPGYPPDRLPMMPPGLFICGTVNADQRRYRFKDTVLGRVGSIEFSTHLQGRPVGQPVGGTPPVGLQRQMLAPPPADGQAALIRLHSLLAPHAVVALEPRPRLAALLESCGVSFDRQTQDMILRYVANSFDAEGRGLFEPDNRLHNYYLALDFQMARQALLWMRCRASLEVQLQVERYIEELFS